MTNEARIVITGDASQAEGALRSLGNSVDGTTRKMLDMSSVAGTLAGALSLAAFTALIKHSIDAGDELAKLAQKTGTTVEELAGLKFAADQNGASLDTVARAGQKLAVVLADKGELFRGIGVTATNSTGAMVQLADVFAAMPDGIEKSALATKLFGDRLGADMIPFLNQGTEALGKLIEKGQKYNPVTAESAKAAEHFNDSLDELKAGAGTLGVSMANALLPKLNETIDAFMDLTASGKPLVDVGKGIGTVFETIVVVGANVGYVFKQTGNEIGGMVAQLVALASGDFSGASKIGEMMRADAAQARKEIDAFSERIVNGAPKQAAAAPVAQDGARGQSLLRDLLPQTADQNEKLRQKDLAGWVKYAEAVLAESEDIQVELNKQIEERNKAEEDQINKTAEAFTKSNQTLAEAAALADASEAERIAIKRDGELARLEEQKQMLLEHNAWTLEMETQYGNARINAKAVADVAFLKLEKQTAIQRQQVLVSSLSSISSLMSSNNESLFAIGQAASIANATISTYEGATKALSYGPFLGPALAAGIIVAGLANVAQIASTKIGGGTPSPVNATFSGGSVSAGTTPAPITAPLPAPNAEVVAPRTQVSLTLQGSQFSYQQVAEQIIPLINEAAGNGADIRVNTVYA